MSPNWTLNHSTMQQDFYPTRQLLPKTVACNLVTTLVACILCRSSTQRAYIRRLVMLYSDESKISNIIYLYSNKLLHFMTN